jgi:cysteine-rich repeat protein
VVVASVDADTAVPAVAQIRVTISNAGASEVHTYPQLDAPAAIRFPTSFAVILPRGRSGTLDLALDGLDASMKVVASAAVRTVIKVGDRTDVTARLAPGPSACGNGQPDPGEQCDDHNRVSGDGCDALCQKEPAPVSPDHDGGAAAGPEVAPPAFDSSVSTGGVGGMNETTGGTSGGGGSGGLGGTSGGSGGLGTSGGSSGGAGGAAGQGVDCSSLPHWQAGTTYQSGVLVVNGAPPHVYRCRDYPFDSWCGLRAYEPGKTDSPWMDAWIDFGACQMGTGSGGNGGSIATGGTGGETGGSGGAVGANGLVSRWKLDEGAGTLLADAGPAGNQGTISGGTTWLKAGFPGAKFPNPGAIAFDGTSGGVELAVKAVPALDQAHSVSLWVSYGSVGTNGQPFIGFGASGSGRLKIGFKTGQLVVWKGDGTILLGTAAPPGGWHHVAYTFDSVTRRLFVDGAERATSIDAGDSGAVSEARLGTYGTEHFVGTLDDVRLFRRALTVGEISLLSSGYE